MKELLCTLTGVLGAAFTGLFGGWSAGLTTLVIFMALDYLTGLLLAGVFRLSKKSSSGALESSACWKGLVKKGITLTIVLVACRLDILIGENYIRDGAVIAFCVAEALSILENAGLMGVPIPAVITRAVEALRAEGDAA